MIDNARSWHGSYGGQGTTPMQGAVPGIAASPDGKMHMQVNSQARWLGADCGSVKPRAAAR